MVSNLALFLFAVLTFLFFYLFDLFVPLLAFLVFDSLAGIINLERKHWS
jgi:hypothetical protein